MKEPVRHYLLQYRKLAKHTQGTVAEAIGYERSYYSRIETGQRPYDQEILEKLAAFYAVEPRDLIGRDPTKPSDIWTIVQSMTDEKLKLLTELARTMAGMPA